MQCNFITLRDIGAHVFMTSLWRHARSHVLAARDQSSVVRTQLQLLLHLSRWSCFSAIEESKKDAIYVFDHLMLSVRPLSVYISITRDAISLYLVKGFCVDYQWFKSNVAWPMTSDRRPPCSIRPMPMASCWHWQTNVRLQEYVGSFANCSVEGIYNKRRLEFLRYETRNYRHYTPPPVHWSAVLCSIYEKLLRGFL